MNQVLRRDNRQKREGNMAKLSLNINALNKKLEHSDRERLTETPRLRNPNENLQHKTQTIGCAATHQKPTEGERQACLSHARKAWLISVDTPRVPKQNKPTKVHRDISPNIQKT